jgi:predicted transcriptional regulator
MSTLVSVRTEEGTIEKLDRIAGILERNRNWVINQAIDNYLEMHAWQLEHIKQGIADSDAGRTFTTNQVRARLAKRHISRTRKKA